MSMQIAKIVLYSHRGEIREVSFRLGAMNILTGASKTGKSAIIDIIDYCSGRSECNVAAGVIRKHVSWYAIIFQLGEGQLFVARKNPGVGDKTSPDVYIARGKAIEIPPFEELHKNITVDALEKFLGSAIGISENEHRPDLQTRDPLEANFRHALLFSLQDQNDIDSKQRLFHRQGEDFIGQAIRDTFPYFLGAVDEERLLKQAQLDQARRQLRQLERQLRDAEEVDTRALPRAMMLLDEARQVGLVDERYRAPDSEAALAALRRIAKEDRARDDVIIADGEADLADLRAERQSFRTDLERVNAEIRSTKLFTAETGGFEREAKEQRARLSAVGLFKHNSDHDPEQCPVCSSVLSAPVPAVTEILSSLQDLTQDLQAVEAENPRLQMRLASLEAEADALENRLRENQQRISARIRENEIQKVQQDTFILRARVIGKVIQYVETAGETRADSTLKSRVDLMRARVTMLEAELDSETVKEKLRAFLNIIGHHMTEYAAQLELEHSNSQLRLDIRNLTVVADTEDGPVPLYKMGSGENWVGYHILAHLALHRWFRKKGRPVPAFLILDQPSQAHYPPSQDVEGSLDVLEDDDRKAVRSLFNLVDQAAKELSPTLQIIIMDHADLKEDWFREAVVERWRGGVKLIPPEWLNN
ncbi:DUF3732 domain-containing protein [Variovorax sp. KK3]|uniref:DUF3732 domain-containing protein n=1 Tax=Variovorax sp. KK3 TaxID=1855728 RepID=UPI00097BB1A9|nr:DUF3732 domain-containing protein [Variovorax sp. KK3]